VTGALGGTIPALSGITAGGAPPIAGGTSFGDTLPEPAGGVAISGGWAIGGAPPMRGGVLPQAIAAPPATVMPSNSARAKTAA
jgi:hypothetical protein